MFRYNAVKEAIDFLVRLHKEISMLFRISGVSVCVMENREISSRVHLFSKKYGLTICACYGSDARLVNR